MIAEQTAACAYWISEQRPPVEIRLTVRLEIPGEEEVDVATTFLFEEHLPGRAAETLHRRLYDGVHGGIAATGFPLPEGGMAIKVLNLHIQPPESLATDGLHPVGSALQALVTEVVAALWSGLSNLELPERRREA